MASDNLMEVESLDRQPVMVRHTEQGIVLRGIENVPAKLQVWKRAGTVAAAGVLFGFGASLWFGMANLPVQKAQRWVRVEEGNSPQTSPSVNFSNSMPVKQVADGSADIGSVDSPAMERLKTRNRRLEALVQVLQKRAQAGKRGKGLTIKN